MKDEYSLANSVHTLSPSFYGDLDMWPMDDGTKSPGTCTSMLQCVDPQYAEERCCLPHEMKRLDVSNSLVNPYPSDTAFESRNASLRVSDMACYNTDLATASSTSSFSSSPGYQSSFSGSVSTAPSSRRQSAIYSDDQTCHFFAGSPKAFFSSDRSKTMSSVDHILHESFIADPQDPCDNILPLPMAHDILARDDVEEYFRAYHDPTRKTSSTYNQLVQHVTPGLPDMNMDVETVSNLNESLTMSAKKFPLPDCNNFPFSTFRDGTPAQGIAPSQITNEPNPPKLEPAFHYVARKGNAKGRNSKVKGNNTGGVVFERKGNIKGNKEYKCDFYPKCKFASDRREHRSRHHRTVHSENPKMIPCAFKDCKDKNKNRKTIKERIDNVTAHYRNTHFNYGETEKSGKNNRKSMQVSLENGLKSYDLRWVLLLAGKMEIGDPAPDQKKACRNAWKTLGYSIRETRDIRIKDIAPEYQGEHETLEMLDPRYKAMKKGELTYQLAMSVGKGMEETKRQGLLGVDMRETEAMGLKHLDPRWQHLLSGNMSIEDSELLGVKVQNLQIRRRRRCDE